MRVGRVLLGVVAVLVVAGAAFLAFAWRSEIAAIEAPAPASFEAGLVSRGAQLAAIGNCNVCHTQPGQPAFAGGRALPTPFGTIYSTNITPDPETGIGRWSEEAFLRSMREGLDREGNHLYPAFPYDHYTKVADDDVRAIYAYLMTRAPVRAEAPANELPFPLNVRLVLAGWKLLFFEEGAFQPDPNRSAAWNRGAYLAEGLSHCGACHTPRNQFGAERRDAAYAGGESESWHAPAINAASPAPVPWDEESLFAYLRQGIHPLHPAAAGPMTHVVENLQGMPDEDVRGLATYFAAVIGAPTPEEAQNGRRVASIVQGEGEPSPEPAGHDAGRQVYLGACAMCHEKTGAMPIARPLDVYTNLTIPDPRNIIHIVLEGLHPGEGERGPLMPGFAGALTDQQVTDLVGYLRARFGRGLPAWENVGDRVREIHQGKQAS